MGFLLIGGLMVTAWTVAGWWFPLRHVDRLLGTYLLGVAAVLVVGYSVSALGRFDTLIAWGIGLVIVMAAAWGALIISGQAQRVMDWQRFGAILGSGWRAYQALPSYKQWLIAPVWGTVAAISVMNLGIALTTAPINWDSHTYHIARVAYYLQNGTTAMFPANFDSQIIVYKNSPVINAFLMLATGSERAMHLSQYVAYWVLILSVYGTARALGTDRFYSLLGAGITGMLTQVVLQATTTQSDLSVAALATMTVYGMMAFRERQHAGYLLFVGWGSMMMIGFKTSALLVGPSMVVVLFVMMTTRAVWDRRYLVGLLGAVSVGAGLFLLPSGPVEIYQAYGDPLGHEEWRTLHEFDLPPRILAIQGTKNVMRFVFDFAGTDGLLFPDVSGAVNVARRAINDSLEQFGITLDDPAYIRAPFAVERPAYQNEDFAYWGVWGSGLVLPLMLAVMVVPGGWVPLHVRGLAWAGAVFFIPQAFLATYDPFRGRLFMQLAGFAVPAAVYGLYRFDPVWRRAVRGETGRVRQGLAWGLSAYTGLVVMLGCVAAIETVIAIRTDNGKLFQQNRVQQLAFRNDGVEDILIAFEATVPPDATVMLDLWMDTPYPQGGSYVYPLFGEGLTRTIYATAEHYHQWGGDDLPDYRLFQLPEAATELDSETVYLGNEWGVTYWYVEPYREGDEGG